MPGFPLQQVNRFGGFLSGLAPASFSAAAAGLIVVQVPFTTAQMQSAAITAAGLPLVVGVPNTVLVPFWWAYSERRVAAFTSTPTMRIRATGSVIDDYAGLGDLAMLAGATTNTDFSTGIFATANTQAPNLTIPPNTTLAGLGLALSLNTPLTGVGTHNGPVVFTVAYIKVPMAF